eukprot:TRINITY_DN5339_c0_g2_i2.p2 TRINITY_DN5339_c0_g2~~TRINITY_DN5339_c0_g2_i2.p2  ORF type:complete len:131 (+),score=20.82 TRINITY_DN5339_c0_g2_i2:585-977(+)
MECNIHKLRDVLTIQQDQGSKILLEVHRTMTEHHQNLEKEFMEKLDNQTSRLHTKELELEKRQQELDRLTLDLVDERERLNALSDQLTREKQFLSSEKVVIENMKNTSLLFVVFVVMLHLCINNVYKQIF